MPDLLARTDRRIKGLLDCDSTPCELFASLPSLIWAVVLAAPGDTFDIGPTYAGLRAWFPEEVWAAMFAAHFACALGGWLRNLRRLRQLSMLSAVFLWLVVLAKLLHVSVLTTGWVYVVPILAAALAQMQITAEARRHGGG